MATRRPIRGEWNDPILREEEAHATLRNLIAARDAARAAGAGQTLRRIQYAISSAKGAIRHAENRASEWRRCHVADQGER